MKCTTCTKSDFESIHGRVFCANCGVDAAKRLQNFSSTTRSNPSPEKIGGAEPQVLDLSANTNPERTVEAKPGPDPRLLDLTQKAPAPQEPSPRVDTPPQNTHAQSLHLRPKVVEDNRPNITEPQPPIDEALIPQQETPQTSQLESVFSGATEEISNTQIEPTHMQPHQTYSLKSDTDDQDVLSDAASPPQYQEQQEQPRERKVKKTRFGFGSIFANAAMRTSAIVLSMVLLTGYVTYLNYPNITLRVAANRANIEASMPGYIPNGYSFSGPITHSPGQLVINFGNKQGGITLKQSQTRWDSQSLLENKIRLSTSSYDTYRENGLTIYTYDNRHAAWINSGILYEIESESELDPEEIIRMASSL